MNRSGTRPRGAAEFPFDSTGHVLRRWLVPRDVEFWDIVEGVTGDEVILAYQAVPQEVFLRFRPDGSYRVSAERPPPLDSAQWVDAGDSTYVMVVPSQPVQPYQYRSGARNVSPGHWIPAGDSGWYVRTDTVPGLPVRSRAVVLHQKPRAPDVTCPRPSVVQDYWCSSFPDGKRRRLIARPSPTT